MAFLSSLLFEPDVLQRRTMRMLTRTSTMDPSTARTMVRLDNEVNEDEDDEDLEFR